jgi:hypothetical protein
MSVVLFAVDNRSDTESDRPRLISILAWLIITHSPCAEICLPEAAERDH